MEAGGGGREDECSAKEGQAVSGSSEAILAQVNHLLEVAEDSQFSAWGRCAPASDPEPILGSPFCPAKGYTFATVPEYGGIHEWRGRRRSGTEAAVLGVPELLGYGELGVQTQVQVWRESARTCASEG